MMSEPTVQDLIMESMATIAQLNERHAILEAAYLKARAVLNMVILDGTIAAVSRELDPATNLRAFIDRYIEQGEELKRARDAFEYICRNGYGFHVADQWLKQYPEKGSV